MNFTDKITIFFRSFLLQAGWNYMRFQSIGFTFVMLPYLRKIYKKKDLRPVLTRYLENFNTHPVMASYAYGALARMEKDDVASQTFKRSEWTITKVFMMSSLASIGDRLFWDTLRPLAFIVALLSAVLLHMDLFKYSHRVNLGLTEAMAAAAIYLLVYNVPAFIIRWKGLSLGYKSDSDDCYGLLAFDWNKTIRLLKLAGFICTLAVVACTLAGQFLYLNLDVEFLLLASVLLFFIMFSFLADKINVPVVYVYIITTVLFSAAVLIL